DFGFAQSFSGVWIDRRQEERENIVRGALSQLGEPAASGGDQLVDRVFEKPERRSDSQIVDARDPDRQAREREGVAPGDALGGVLRAVVGGEVDSESRGSSGVRAEPAEKMVRSSTSSVRRAISEAMLTVSPSRHCQRSTSASAASIIAGANWVTVRRANSGAT